MSVEPDKGSFFKVMASMGFGVSDPLHPPYNEEWTNRGEDITPHLVRLISPARKQVLIATGHPDLDLFQQQEVTKSFREALERGVEISLLFGTNSLKTAEDATTHIRTHPEGLADLKQHYPDRLHLIWNPRGIMRDVVVVDGESVINTDPGATFGDKPGTVITMRDQKWGKRWVDNFSAAVNRSREITFI